MLAIRAATDTDISTLARLDAQSTYWPWSERAWADSVTGGHEVHVLLSDGQPIAAAVTMHCVHDAELLNIVVKMDYQRRGMGHYLLEYVFSFLHKQHLQTLFLEVRESNQPARALYEKVGFKEIGIRPHYYPSVDSREHAILMEKKL